MVLQESKLPPLEYKGKVSMYDFVDFQKMKKQQIIASKQNKCNPYFFIEIVWFAASFALGAYLINASSSGPFDAPQAASILLGAGFITLYGQILVLIETLSPKELLTPNNGVAVLIIICSVAMPKDVDGGIRDNIGQPLIEGSVIYFIYRLLFLQEGDEAKIKKLEEENAKLRKSAAKGLAGAYFWNFVKKAGESLSEFHMSNSPAVCKYTEVVDDVKTEKNATLKTKKMLIFVPLTLDCSAADHMNEILDKQRSMSNKKLLHEGKIEPLNKGGKVIYCKYLENNDDGEVDGLMDIPTSLNILKNNAQKNYEMAPEQELEEEARLFITELITLINENSLDQFIKVIAIEELTQNDAQLYQEQFMAALNDCREEDD